MPKRIVVYQLPNEGLLDSRAPTSMPARNAVSSGGGRSIMLKRVAVLVLLAPLTLGNLSRPVEAAGWGPLAALVVANLAIPPDAGWRHGGGFRRAPYYPRRYDGFYRDGGSYRAPYYPRYSGAYYGGYNGCGGYGNYGDYGGYGGYGNDGGYGGGYGRYGGYEGYGYDGYGW
jgi:hypothetical protein